MSVIGKSRLDAVARSYRALFFQGLEKNKNALGALASQFFMEVGSTGQKENYNWIGDVPALQTWRDARPHERLRVTGYEIENVDYATGIEVHANDLDDDRLNLVQPRINGLVDAVQLHKFTQFKSLLEAGISTACYDGQNFFSASHSEGSSGTQSNYLTSSATLSSTNVRAAYAAMTEYKNDQGNLMGITPTHLFTSPAQMGTALDIIGASTISTGGQNMDLSMGLKLIIIPGLTTTVWWGLVDLSKSLKPFIFQNRRAVNFTSLTDPESPDFYNTRRIKFGVDYRAGFGYGMWQLMYLADGA
jgi:phage major head subunit gpT-like protein